MTWKRLLVAALAFGISAPLMLQPRIAAQELATPVAASGELRTYCRDYASD